jgi:hypothetical protein
MKTAMVDRNGNKIHTGDKVLYYLKDSVEEIVGVIISNTARATRTVNILMTDGNKGTIKRVDPAQLKNVGLLKI